MGQEQPHPIDKNLITITTAQSVSQESAVLSAVKHREIELKTELLKARQAADEILAAGRSEAAAIRSGAATSGQNKAGKVVENEVSSAKRTAAEIGETTDKAVKELETGGRKNFDRAVEFVLQAVLPRSGKEAENVLDDGQS